MKILICLALFAVVFCSDTPDTPAILTGVWKLNMTIVDESSKCCTPTGDLTITSNHNRTITLTSTSWTGSECAGRTASYEEVIKLNGADSYNQLLNTNSSGPYVITSDSTSQLVGIEMDFSGNLDWMLMMFPEDGDNHCVSAWTKEIDNNGIEES